MKDVLRACTAVPRFIKAAQIVLVEASPALRDVQRETLTRAEPVFLDDLEGLPAQPLFLIANEFFDALPIRQFVRDGAQWRERQVGVEDGTLAFGLGPASAQPTLTARLEDTQDGDLVEVCASIAPALAQIGQQINDHGGAALIIDYGDWRSLGDTFQALQDHARVDPLATPGMADLTAHVDFEALAQAVPCPFTRITPQGVFLERLGITQRAQALATRLSDAALEAHIAAHRRLTHPQEMGNPSHQKCCPRSAMGSLPAAAENPLGFLRG